MVENYKNAKRGEVIYGLFGVIDPEEAKNRYSIKFWAECLSLFKMGGWKKYIVRLSSPISTKMMLKLGATLIKKVQVQDSS